MRQDERLRSQAGYRKYFGIHAIIRFNKFVDDIVDNIASGIIFLATIRRQYGPVSAAIAAEGLDDGYGEPTLIPTVREYWTGSDQVYRARR